MCSTTANFYPSTLRHITEAGNLDGILRYLHGFRYQVFVVSPAGAGNLFCRKKKMPA
jgi:hypothetical protein